MTHRIQMIRFKYILCCAVLLTILLLFGCKGNSTDDEQEILEMYTEIIQAFAREDLRGVMFNISKDFQSDVEYLQTYGEILEHRRSFILNNSKVSVNFRDISIVLDGSHAEVSYRFQAETDQVEMSWSEIDMLQKSWSGWEIYSWQIIVDS